MPDATRTYWLTTSCRIRRQDQSLRIERESGDMVHIPVTDVRDIIAAAPVDINTAAVSLLNRHRIDIHLLNYFGDYTGSLLSAEGHASGPTILAQAQASSSPDTALPIAASIVQATAFNIRRVVDRKLLDRPFRTLADAAAAATDRSGLMGVEGNFRRTAWALIDTRLPEWLRLDGRSRRPPANAGNAFISYANAIVYARTLSALRLTPLHSTLGFLHSTLERHRHALALDLAEMFKPLFAERLLLRLSARKQLSAGHFDATSHQAMLSPEGRKFVITTIRDELATTVRHRGLNRAVTYDELLYLEALKLTRSLLEGTGYKPFRIWW